MNYYIFDICTRVPLFTAEQLASYYEQNVKPYVGTSYGNIEMQMYREMRLANKLGRELVGIPDKVKPLRLNDNASNKDS